MRMSMGGVDSPMHDRLSIQEMCAMSPASKGKAPLQLPAPPPGMPSSNVAKWRSEMAKIFKKRIQMEERASRSAIKDRDRQQRDEERINAQVAALNKRLMANTPGPSGTVPQTQIASDDADYDEEEDEEYGNSEEMAAGEVEQEGYGQEENLDNNASPPLGPAKSRDALTSPAMARGVPPTSSGGGGATGSKGGALAATLHHAITGLDAANEARPRCAQTAGLRAAPALTRASARGAQVGQVLAARKKRIEDAERSKLGPSTTATRAAQEQAALLEQQQLKARRPSTLTPPAPPRAAPLYAARARASELVGAYPAGVRAAHPQQAEAGGRGAARARLPGRAADAGDPVRAPEGRRDVPRPARPRPACAHRPQAARGCAEHAKHVRLIVLLNRPDLITQQVPGAARGAGDVVRLCDRRDTRRHAARARAVRHRRRAAGARRRRLPPGGAHGRRRRPALGAAAGARRGTRGPSSLRRPPRGLW